MSQTTTAEQARVKAEIEKQVQDMAVLMGITDHKAINSLYEGVMIDRINTAHRAQETLKAMNNAPWKEQFKYNGKIAGAVVVATGAAVVATVLTANYVSKRNAATAGELKDVASSNDPFSGSDFSEATPRQAPLRSAK